MLAELVGQDQSRRSDPKDRLFAIELVDHGNDEKVTHSGLFGILANFFS